MSLCSTAINSPILIALDYSEHRRAMAFVDAIDPASCRLKVGKEMFTRFGPHLVHDLQQRGFDVFLDLKFHDIPHTVARAVTAAADLGVWMVNVHASGGARMMTAARDALNGYGKDSPLLIAVTVLTSMMQEDLHSTGIDLPVVDQVLNLARLTHQCGLNGVVCSAQEAVKLKATLGENFKLVTPGIRLTDHITDDQRRTMTPQQAQQAGIDYMVIGRPITCSDNPVQTLRAIMVSLQGIL